MAITVPSGVRGSVSGISKRSAMKALGIDDTNFSPSKGMVSSELHTALATPRTDQGSVRPVSFRKYVNVVNNALTTHAPNFVTPTGDNTIEWTFVEWKVPTEFRIERRSNSNENRLDTTPWVELVAEQTAKSYEDTATNLEEFVEYRVTPVTAAGDGVAAVRAATLQDAEITINGITGPARVRSGDTVEFVLDMEGQWDTIWFTTVSTPIFFSGTFGDLEDDGTLPLLAHRTITTETDYSVTIRVTVSGTGTNAKDATTDRDTVTFDVTLFPGLNIFIDRTVPRQWIYSTDVEPNRYLAPIDFFATVMNGTEPYSFEPPKNFTDPDDSSIRGWRRFGANVNGGDLSITVVVTDDEGETATDTRDFGWTRLPSLQWSLELDNREGWAFDNDSDSWLYAADFVSAAEFGGAEPYSFSPAKNFSGATKWRRFAGNEDGGTLSFTATMSDAGTMSLEKSISITYPPRQPPIEFSLAATGDAWATFDGNYRYRIYFTPTVSGGDAPYTYNPVRNSGTRWARFGGTLAGGTISLTVVVTDDNGDTAEASASFTYPAAPAIQFSLSASGVGWAYSTADSRALYRVNFSGSASGGPSPYTYNPARNSGSVWARFGSATSGGTVSLTVVVTDAASRTATASSSFNYPALPALSFSLSSTGVGWLLSGGNVVYRINFSGSASGGLSPYSYSPARNSGTVWARFGSNRAGGTVSHSVVATDAAGQTRTATDSHTYPRLPALSFNLSASGAGWSGTGTAARYRVNFSGAASGGLSPYSYNPVQNAVGRTVWARFGGTQTGGTLSLSVVATDAAGQTRTGTASFTYPAR